MKKTKSKCCKKFKKKSKACGKCPLMSRLQPKDRSLLIAKFEDKRKKKSKI